MSALAGVPTSHTLQYLGATKSNVGDPRPVEEPGSSNCRVDVAGRSTALLIYGKLRLYQAQM